MISGNPNCSIKGRFERRLCRLLKSGFNRHNLAQLGSWKLTTDKAIKRVLQNIAKSENCSHTPTNPTKLHNMRIAVVFGATGTQGMSTFRFRMWLDDIFLQDRPLSMLSLPIRLLFLVLWLVMPHQRLPRNSLPAESRLSQVTCGIRNPSRLLLPDANVYSE